MARDLYARLKRLKEYHGAAHSDRRELNKPAPATPHSSEPAANRVPVGWSEAAQYVYTRRSKVAVAGPPGAGMASRALGRDVNFSDLCFMDTETTGLSGGAGTTVFLVGSARYADGLVVVQQTLLGDFPGEPEFLSVVKEQLWSSPVWVSYNGNSFDSRLLQTRFILSGQQVLLPEQLDLLYWSRRLWRRKIGRCSLGDIEREVLGLERSGDVSGIEIPDLYFDFLRSADPTGLLPVFSHHLQDIVSLVQLFFRIEQILESVDHGNEYSGNSPFDRIGLGRHLAMASRGGAEALLLGAVTHPDDDESLDQRERGAMVLARLYRQQGRGDAAVQLWERLWADGSILAGIQLSKHLEHQSKEFSRALDLVDSISSLSDEESVRRQLDHRMRRLSRKLAR